jgi:TRAP-type C4-dicarboxylate transport system permease small subunit
LPGSNEPETPGATPRASPARPAGPAVRAFRWLVDAILVTALAVISIVLICQVVLRYVFHAALPWPEELAQFLLVLLTLLGGYRALEMDMHIRLQVLDDFRWPRLVMLLRLAGYAASAAFMLYVAYGGWDLTMRSMHTPSTALRMPMGVVYATLPIAFGLMTILLVGIMVRLVRGRDVVLDRPE